jgi:hypothetical protein
LTTFFRHFSLYEFAFTRRVELILKTQAVIRPDFNAKMHDLEEAEEVSKEEAE